MKRALLGWLMAMVLVLVGVGIVGITGLLNQSIGEPTSKQSVVIEPGQSFYQMVQAWDEEGLLTHAWWVKWYGRYRGISHRIRAGEYWFEGKLSVDQWFERIVSGQSIQHSVTLVPGWRYRDIETHLCQQEPLVCDLPSGLNTLKPTIQSHWHDKNWAVASQIDPMLVWEGQFLADTYLYQRGTKASDVLRQAHKALQQVLLQAWETRHQQRLHRKTFVRPNDVLVMASLIEKETGVAAERSMISGVFNRRLHKRMRLQSDPTVIVAMGKAYDIEPRIRQRHLKMKHPYNTYTNFGLPPGPIAIVGKAAIEAAANPMDTKALYFVADGEGGHVFSNTLVQHNQAVKAYVRQLNARKRK